MKLPDFDELVRLAQTDPESFESFRKDVCEEFISQAPEQYQRRLRGIQFQIDMEVEKASNPMAACVKVSQMMHESFHKLRIALNQFQESEENNMVVRDIVESAPEAEFEEAKILTFPAK